MDTEHSRGVQRHVGSLDWSLEWIGVQRIMDKVCREFMTVLPIVIKIMMDKTATYLILL